MKGKSVTTRKINFYKQEQTGSSSFPGGGKNGPKREGLSSIKKKPVTKTHLKKTTRSTMAEPMQIFQRAGTSQGVIEKVGSSFVILIKFQSVDTVVPGRLSGGLAD